MGKRKLKHFENEQSMKEEKQNKKTIKENQSDNKIENTSDSTIGDIFRFLFKPLPPIEFEEAPSPQNRSLTGDNLTCCISYMECHIEKLINEYRMVWNFERTETDSKFDIEGIFIDLEDKYTKRVFKEWHQLKRGWQNCGKIMISDVEDICSILNAASTFISLRVAKIQNYSRTIKKQDFPNRFWNKEIKHIEQHMVETSDNYGSIFVPETCKVNLPCAKTGIFQSVEIGIDWNGRPVVVKHLKPGCKMDEITVKVSQLRKLSHRHLLPCYLTTLHSAKHILATPLMDYNLGQLVMYLNHNGQINKHGRDIVRQIISGLHHMHSHYPPLLHGNLKPTNIFADGKGIIKIGDSCLMLKQKSEKSKDDQIWNSPEMLHGEKPTLASDIASAGMLLHFVLSGGHHPFGNYIKQILNNVSEGFYQLEVGDSAARDLLMQMMEHEPLWRPNIQKVVRHVFWNSVQEQSHCVRDRHEKKH